MRRKCPHCSSKFWTQASLDDHKRQHNTGLLGTPGHQQVVTPVVSPTFDPSSPLSVTNPLADRDLDGTPDLFEQNNVSTPEPEPEREREFDGGGYSGGAESWSSSDSSSSSYDSGGSSSDSSGSSGSSDSSSY